MPKVNVLLPFMSADKYLVEAINSIKKQTFRDLNVILVCNGDEKSYAEASSYLETHLTSLSFVHVREGRRGVAEALNTGLTYCDGKYIARMDADDLMLPERIEQQVSVLDKSSYIAGLGSSAIKIDQNGHCIGKLHMPRIKNMSRLLSILRYENPFIHPSVTMQADVLHRFRYLEGFRGCEDWNLWVRIAKEGRIVENWQRVLMKYRIHIGQETKRQDSESLREPLLKTLELLDAELINRYSFQRKYLEDYRPTLRQTIEVISNEVFNINTIFSLKKMATSLMRSCNK